MGSSIPMQEFERAYRSEAAYVAALMGRLCVPDEAIKDAVQDVFVAAYRRWPDFDRSRAVRPWLTGFARHVAFRYRRSAARRYRRGLAFAVERRDQTEPGPHHQTHARDFLTRFLGAMSPEHRQAFLLSEYDGLTGPEIAARLGISTEAAYGRVRAARRRLRQALMADVGSTDPRAAGFVPPWGLVLARLQTDVPTATATTITSLAPTSGGLLLKATGLALACAAGLVIVSGAHQPSSRTPVQRPDGSDRPGPSDAVPRIAEVSGPVVTRTEAEVPAPRAMTPTRRSVPREASPPDAPGGGGQKRSPSTSPGAELQPTRPEAPVAAKSSHNATARSLAEEAALLREAKRLLGAGDGVQALQRLSEHARSFPRGQLADARERTRIRALCDLGRTAEARAEASRMVAARPSDPLAREALSICSSDPIQNDAEAENQDR